MTQKHASFFAERKKLSLSFLPPFSLVSFASRVFHRVFSIWRDELFNHGSIILETCIKVIIVYLHCVAAGVSLYLRYTCTVHYF